MPVRSMGFGVAESKFGNKDMREMRRSEEKTVNFIINSNES
jgi:hypothetical protein